MQALHFGAGNIGRGFIGKLLADSNFQVTFADINQQIIAALHSQQQYQVNVVGEQVSHEIVKNVDAIDSRSEAVISKIAQVELITTAVGPQVLPHIAKSLADGIIARCEQGNQQPLNIIACENMLRATSQLKAATLAILPANYHAWLEQHVGFVDSAVDRIVPQMAHDPADPLTVTVETFCEWIVDQTQFVGQPPQIAGMQLTDNLPAFIERKLFTLNTGHAITAYLGNYYGIATIREAIANPKIAEIVKGAMLESGAVLIRRYGFDAAQHHAYIDKILSRFANPYLQDDTARVGRQPIRKLSPNDRLIKPLLGTLEYQLPNQNLLIGIAAALSFRQADDEQANQIAQMIADKGVSATLSELSGIAMAEPVVKKVADLYHCMQNNSF